MPKGERVMNRYILSAVAAAFLCSGVVYAQEGGKTNDTNASALSSAKAESDAKDSAVTASGEKGVANAASKSISKALFSQEELDQALAPIALYPDSLLAQVLMATTYPEQLMEAAKWSKENPKMKGDEAVKAVQDKDWDTSVSSLVAFPQVLELLSSKPEWSKKLGDMFLSDPDAVMSTIQKLRLKAKEAGNLKSTKEQKVIVKEGSTSSSATSGGGDQTTIIEIHPANPETVYVPVYNPTVVYGSWWYPSHPPYYYHPPYITPVGAIIGFGAAVAAAHCLWSHWDWHHHDIDIDIHRHNNINIKKKLEVNKDRLSWRQNMRERNGRLDRSKISNRLDGRRPVGGSDRRDRMNREGRLSDRTRDVKRDAARNALEKKGIDLGEKRKEMLRDRGNIEKKVDRINRENRMSRPARGESAGKKISERRQGIGEKKISRPASRDVKRPSGRDIKRAPTRERRRPAVERSSRRPAVQRAHRSVSRPAVNRPTRQIRGNRGGGGLRNR